MRLVRIQIQPRKVVIYHATLADIVSRALCLVGKHAYEAVREYPRVGAKEEMCVHCLKPRYTLAPAGSLVEKTA
jgi:hypothetical protein